MALNVKRNRANNDEMGNGYIDSEGTDDDDYVSEEGSQNLKMVEDQVGEWNGFDSIDDTGATSISHQPPLRTKPPKPPTSDELRNMQDAADLYQSSSFKLQIDELLPNVRPRKSRIPPLERALHALHNFLSSLPSITAQHPLQAARHLQLKRVAVPYCAPLPTEETNWKVAFEKPTSIAIAGGWIIGTSVKNNDGGKFAVDLAVEIPNSLFVEKDYLNGRFFNKRAFYLATLAAAISDPLSGLAFDAFYESKRGDIRLSTLNLIPREDNSSNDFTKLHAEIRIVLHLAADAPITIQRLSPSSSNLRLTSENDKTTTRAATPIYNSMLLLAFTPKPHLMALHTLNESVPAFKIAVALLRVWANQRGYGTGERMCVHGFEGRGPFWSALLGLLVAGSESSSVTGGKIKAQKPLGKGLSSYQLFKAGLDFLSRNDIEKSPLFLKTKDGHVFQPKEYSEYHGAVLVDSHSLINHLVDVPLTSLDLLKHDATVTLQALNNPNPSRQNDTFAGTFLQDMRDLLTRFDSVIHVDVSNAKPGNSSLTSILDWGSSSAALFASLSDVLRCGLGDRTKAIAILHPSSTARPLVQGQPSTINVIHIGLIHNSENAFRLVDHGPAADDADTDAADRFRAFWGNKAELRRFKDGRITESVVWDVQTADERAHIPVMILRHLLGHHFGLSSDAITGWQPSFDTLLRLPQEATLRYHSANVAVGFKAATSAFDQMVKDLRALDDKIPLAILSVSPVSSYLRHTNATTPTALAPKSVALPVTMSYSPGIEIIIEFEKSGRWPDDLKAIQKVKLAFFEAIAVALQADKPGYRATVVLGNGDCVPEIQDQARLEIITPTGWVFVAGLWHDREATLLDGIINHKVKPGELMSQVSGKIVADAQHAKLVYLRRFIHAPRHHRAIATITHKFVAYAGTVRLVKRWFAAHWLLNTHVSEEAVELLCASFFVGKEMSAPASRERGFSAVLQFLTRWRWEEGLDVDIIADEASTSVGSTKYLEKKGVWSLRTQIDREGWAWTNHGPDVLAANRVRAVAHATWAYMSRVESGILDVSTIYEHPTDSYDFILELEPSQLPRYLHNVRYDPDVLTGTTRGKFANLVSPAEVEPGPTRAGFDPAHMYFEDLKQTYADTAALFMDVLGGAQIGGVWKPAVLHQRAFRVRAGYNMLPNEGDSKKDKEGQVTLNIDAVLAEMARMGVGLVKRIRKFT